MGWSSALALRAGGRSHPKERSSTADLVPSGAVRAHEADDVLDAGLDSFPASDPPSWSPLRVGAPGP